MIRFHYRPLREKKMDTKNIILAVIFTFSLLLLWESWTARNTVEPTLNNLTIDQKPVVNDGNSFDEVPKSTVLNNSDSNDLEFGTNDTVKASEGNLITIENKDLKLSINLKGARIEYAELLTQVSDDYEEGHIILFNNKQNERYEAQSGLFAFPGGGNIYPNHTSNFIVVENANNATNSVTLIADINDIKLIREISLNQSGYEISFKSRVINNKPNEIDTGIYYQLVRNGNPPRGGSSFYQTYTGPAFYTEKDKFQKVDFEDIFENKAEHTKKANDGWFGIIQHHYVSAWILNNTNSREYYTRSLPNSMYGVGTIQHLGKIQPGQYVEHSAKLYAGPQLQNDLKKLAPGLELVVDYGVLTVIAKPIFWLLDKIFSFVGNWGWSIVVLTIIIKLIFYPLTAASYKSMAKMKAVTPRMVKIREQFKDDKMQMNKALMNLYQKEKINPLGGCLPVLVQIPVFIALYWVLLGSVEIRNAPWIFWIKDLSVPDPFYILPLIMAVTMFIQMKLNPTPPDPLQAKIMMMMPVVFSIFFFFFPSGLVLYWLVNNVVSIAQQWSIMRRLNVKV